jgi:hypothetical protein
MIDWCALRLRCQLWFMQAWPFRLLAWLAQSTVPNETGFGPAPHCAHPDFPLQAIFDPKYDHVFSIENSLRLFKEADARVTPADRWWIAEMRELHVHREELESAERALIRILWRAGIATCTLTLSCTWLWLRLTGRN